MTALESYILAGRKAGCPADQMGRFANADIVLQPRQLLASAAARQADKADGPTAIGYGGARGGGKSHWLLAQMGADDCQRVPNLKCLLLRKVGKANLENFQDLKQRLFGSVPHTFKEHKGILSFPNGSKIIAGHFQAEKDIDNYLGLEYDVIGIEEATTLSSRKYTDISTCSRSSKPGWRPRIYSTTNPGGIGHAWYKQRFIMPHQEKREVETRFIPARVTDNSFNNPEYRKVLENLTGWQKRSWLDGDWDIAAGQFFTTFRREVHTLEDFDPRLATEWWGAMDYGFTHYTVFLLGCRDGDGNVYVVDEHAERMWLPQRHAMAINEMLSRWGVGVHSLKRLVIGADAFSRQSDGTTVAGQYAQLGFRFKVANNDRVNGWAEILRRLGDVQHNLRPSLFIHKRCRRTLECLPVLQHDPHRPEDVLKVDADEDGIGGDDAADCLRYLIQTNPRQVGMRKLRGL